MNSIKAFVVIAILAIAGTTFAQNTASDNTGKASADVICRISIQKVKDIYWGKIVSSPSGSATINGDGSETYNNGSDPGASQHGNQTRAHFTVTGQGGASYAITNTNLPTAVSDGSGNVMSVSMSAPLNVAGGLLGSPLLGEGGCQATQDYYYAGTVTEAAGGSPAGNYNNTNAGGSGPWTETVTYN